jgi:hypothetical protein
MLINHNFSFNFSTVFLRSSQLPVINDWLKLKTVTIQTVSNDIINLPFYGGIFQAVIALNLYH